jgi:hypothetical protein
VKLTSLLAQRFRLTIALPAWDLTTSKLLNVKNKTMKKQNLFAVYAAPQVRVCDIRIESGFAQSNPSDFVDPEFETRPEE